MLVTNYLPVRHTPCILFTAEIEFDEFENELD